MTIIKLKTSLINELHNHKLFFKFVISRDESDVCVTLKDKNYSLLIYRSPYIFTCILVIIVIIPH